MTQPINRDLDGRYRPRAEWIAEAQNILVRDQERRSISDEEFADILDSNDGLLEYGLDHQRFIEAWEEWIAEAR